MMLYDVCPSVAFIGLSRE